MLSRKWTVIILKDRNIYINYETMKLAVLIIGLQNSGKTTTLREIVKIHTGKEQKQMKAGWRILSLFPEFHDLTIHSYFIPASPSETNLKISDRFEKLNPEILFVAEQINGQNYSDTMAFLTINNYTILRYDLINREGDNIWERFNEFNKSQRLYDRTNLIMNDIHYQIKINYFEKIIK